KIRKWNCVYKESKKCGTRNLKVKHNSLDFVIDKGDSTDLVVNRRMEVIQLMQEMEKVDNLEVPQKAKIKWAIEGDENSKYYHGVLNKKRSRLTIRGVLADGIWIELPHLVKKEFFIHFKQRFEQPSHQNIRLEMDFVNRLSLDLKDALESEVTNDEVRKAVWDCGVDKTPRPDGFTFGFYRRYWKIIERDVIKVVKWFFLHWSIPNGGNASFITLIPKIPNANMVKDFKPISLIGSIYKLVAKILANRLVTVLGDLVNEIQSAFVADRQILNELFILNEIVQWCKKRNKQTMVFKVDFEKAYNSVRWDFIEDILRKFGFGDKWCTWIQSCLQSSRGSVIVNGSPTEEFQFYKGLKQSDPLSPFLFSFVMEILYISFQRVVDDGIFKGIKLGSSLQMSHLFYADDAIFMRLWNQNNINNITRVLDVFYRASRLRINMHKSQLMGISVDANLVKQAASKIGCMVLKTPFKYLSFRVGDLMSRIQSWSEIIEGRDFFNGIDVNSRKPSWVRWKSVMASKDVGGLGVSSLFALNRALMFKWVWMFISQITSLWARVILALHGDAGKIGKQITSTYPSTWLTIVQEVEALKMQGLDLLSFINPKLGNGLNTSFWDVPWHGDIAFKELALRIYALESLKGISVETKLSHGGLDQSLRRKPRSGAKQVQLELLQDLMHGCMLSNSNDRWSWSLDGGGDFTVSSVRKAIDNHILPKGTTKTRWIKEVPIKINIHAWKV
nr:RNA-directed DNA polymerase, eukaryota [Tanacetum cinerariifolium]